MSHYLKHCGRTESLTEIPLRSHHTRRSMEARQSCHSKFTSPLLTYRVALQCQMTEEQSVALRLAELEAFDQKVIRAFKKGDLVLAVKRPIIISRLSSISRRIRTPFISQVKKSLTSHYLLNQKSLVQRYPPIQKMTRKLGIVRIGRRTWRWRKDPVNIGKDSRS